MKAMTQFNFHTHAIRVFPTDDGNSFMAVAADVAEAQGVPRDEIAARSGKNSNHIRQIVHQARLAGRLPQQRELNLA